MEEKNFRYVIEFRKQKINVETFGLKEWFEAVVFWCGYEYLNRYDPKKYKVFNNLGRCASKKNIITIIDSKHQSKTRPSFMFETLESLKEAAIKQIKHHYFENKNRITDDIGDEIPEIVVYNVSEGIIEVLNLNQ